MHLIKFCKPEHNIRSGSQLQIGTLYKYRHIENSELQDDEEGNFSMEVNFQEEIELDRRMSNLLLSGLLHVNNDEPDDTPRFPGSFECITHGLEIAKANQDSVIIRGGSLTIKRSVPNCLIFCMSAMNDANDNPFDSYKDYWHFPIEKADQFAIRIGNLLLAQAPLSTFEQEHIKKLSVESVKKLKLQIRHQKILYNDRILNVTNENMITFDDLVRTIHDIPFMKPATYINECEYRFAFALNDGEKVIQPVIDDIFVELNALADI